MDQEEQELRERKTGALVDLVSKKCGEVSGSKESLHSFLRFFARIANRWSAPNAMAIYGQRPEIKNPITVEQAKKLGHSIKPGTTAISILEPTVIDQKLARKNGYLMFRKWALGQGVTEQDLRRLCIKHVEQSLGNDLDLRSAKASLVLKQLIFEAYSSWDRQQTNQLYNYAWQYLNKEGAFNSEEIRRGKYLYQWKARSSVVDLGVDTLGPRMPRDVGDQESLMHRRSAAILRFIETKGYRVDYKQLEGLAPAVKLDSLVKSAVSVLAHERGQVINVEAAAFCIYSQLGIDRKFDISTVDGWGEEPGEFMANLSAIRRIQKEIITGLEREMETIVNLERELARTETQACRIRARLNQLGIPISASRAGPGLPTSAPASAAAKTINGSKLSQDLPIIRKEQLARATPDQLDHRGLYFKVGRVCFLTHNEVAEFLVASRFVASDGKELQVELKLRDESGGKQKLCEISASNFVHELINTHSEPVMVRALDSALATADEERNQTTALEGVQVDQLEHDPHEQEQQIKV
jgi:hypothetical protein